MGVKVAAVPHVAQRSVGGGWQEDQVLDLAFEVYFTLY